LYVTLEINTREIEPRDFIARIYANMNVGDVRPTLGWKLSNARKTYDGNRLESDEDIREAFDQIVTLNSSPRRTVKLGMIIVNKVRILCNFG